MAQSDKIRSQDIVQDNLFKDLQKSTKDARTELDLLEKTFLSLIDTQKKVLQTSTLKTSEDIKKVTKAIEEEAAAETALNEVRKAKKKLSEEEQAIAELERKARRERINELKAEQILQDKHRGTLEKLNAANVKLRAARAALNTTTKEGQKELERINKLIDINNAQIIKQSDYLKRAKLNVGNYSASIRAAISELGVFDNGIGRLIVTLRNFATNMQKGEESASKLKLALKGITALGIVGVITGIVSSLKSSQEVVDQTSLLWAKLKDLIVDTFVPGGKGGFAAAERGIQSLKKEMRAMNAEMQILILDQEDFKQISEDTTLGFDERNAAMQKTIEYQKQINDLNVKMARQQKESIDQQVMAMLGSGIAPSNELLDQQAEAQLKLNDALDKQADYLTIDIPEAERKRAALQLGIEEDLIRSKKRSSTIQRDLLQQQINDEKRQIEEREADLIRLNKLQRNLFEEQIRIFKERTGRSFNEQELINETDPTALAERLKKLQLGEEQIMILATIIKKAQDDIVTATANENKLLDDKATRLKKISEIQREISQMQADDAQRDLEFAQRKAEFDTAGLLQTATANPSKKNLDALKEALSAEEVLNQSLFEQKAKGLEAQKKLDEQNAQDTITDKKVLAEELLKIQTQYDIDIANLEEDAAQSQRELKKKNDDLLIGLEKQKTEAIINELSKITQATSDEIDKRSAKQQKAFETEISMREKNLDLQADLAAQGKENQLAFEKAKLEKARLEQRDAEEKAARQKEIVQLTDTYFNFLNAELKKEGANPSTAAGKALSETLLARGLSRQMVQYFSEGTERVEGPGTRTSDSIPAMLSRDEAVIKADANMSNPGVAKALNDGTFSQKFAPIYDLRSGSTAENMYASIAIQTNKEIAQKLDELIAKPVQQWEFDGLGNLIETVYSNGIKTVTQHKIKRL